MPIITSGAAQGGAAPQSRNLVHLQEPLQNFQQAGHQSWGGQRAWKCVQPVRAPACAAGNEPLGEQTDGAAGDDGVCGMMVLA